MPKESPTDFLIRTLEDIEGAEDVIVVFRKTVDGVDIIDWKANDVPAWKAIGMLTYTSQNMYQETLVEDDEEG